LQKNYGLYKLFYQLSSALPATRSGAYINIGSAVSDSGKPGIRQNIFSVITWQENLIPYLCDPVAKYQFFIRQWGRFLKRFDKDPAGAGAPQGLIIKKQ
jgi:hypothetical protein